MRIHTANRGQSIVLGAILVFGILILGLGLVQLYVVPQQVAQTEHNHVNQIENEFTDLYSSITNAAGDNNPRSATLTLGTRYPIFPPFIMPSPASGTVRTVDHRNLSWDGTNIEVDGFDDALSDTCGLGNVSSKSLHYEARYHEFRGAGEHIYESGLKYKRIDGNTIRPQQRLIVQSRDETMTTINLVPITRGSTQETGSTARSLSFEPGLSGETQPFNVSNGDSPTLTIPIQDEAAWNDAFNEEFQDDAHVSLSITNGNAEVSLDDPNHTYRIRCTPIGIDVRPDNNPNPPNAGDGTGASGPLNPVGDGELVLSDVTSGGEWSFINTADNQINVTHVRIPWMLEPGNQDSELNISKDGIEETVPIAHTNWTTVGPPGWSWPANEEEQSIIVSSASTGNSGAGPNDGYALVFRFDDGTTSTYLISPQSGSN